MRDPKKPPPMRYCFYCGEELGRSWDRDPYDNCGKLECQREASNALAEERERAHEALDRDRGWDR